MRNIILNESQIGLLAESLSSKLYHFTSINALFEILKNNEMFCQSSLAGSADDMDNKYKFYISFSRTKNANEGFGSNYNRNGSARIEFDGNKLNQRFKGAPVNYWGASVLNNKWNYNRYASGVQDYYEYDSLSDGEEIDGEVVDKKKIPSFPTSRSPKYINVNGTIFVKRHHDGEHDKTIAYKYKKTDFNADNAPDGAVELSSDFRLKYPNKISPEYVVYNGVVYHKERDISNEIKTHVDNEIEDRLFTNKHIIDNIRDYIIRCDVLVTDFEKLSERGKRIIYNLALRFGSIVNIYNNSEDYIKQSENIINQQISNIDDAYTKYNDYFGDEKLLSHDSIDILKNLFSMLKPLFFNDKKKFKEFVAKTMREFGFDKLIKPIMKSLIYYSDSYKLSADNLSNALFSASKNPSKEGMEALNLVTTLFRRYGFKNIRDALKKIDKEYDIRNGRLNDYIDANIKVPITILKLGYSSYDVTNMSETDFWHIIGCDDFNDRKDFIRNLLYNMDDDMISHTKDSDINKFEKYLLHLAHNKIDFMTMINLFKKIGFEDYLRDYAGYNWEIKVENLDYFNYLYDIYFEPPFNIGNQSNKKFIEEKAFNYFKK